jgi:hypothetical protein
MVIAVQHRKAIVLGGTCCDQRVGDRNAVVAVVAGCQLSQCPRGCVRDCAIVAHDAQRVELGFEWQDRPATRGSATTPKCRR